MQFKIHTFAVFALLALWATPAPAEQIVEYLDVPNRIAWLPEGSHLVLSFLIDISGKMINIYSLALERVKLLREALRRNPPAYSSIDLFFDNDIQQPLDHDKIKPEPPQRPGYAKDAFRQALETIQAFAGKRIRPLDKH